MQQHAARAKKYTLCESLKELHNEIMQSKDKEMLTKCKWLAQIIEKLEEGKSLLNDQSDLKNFKDYFSDLKKNMEEFNEALKNKDE